MTSRLPIKTRLTLAFTCLLAAVLAVSGTLLAIGFAAQLDKVIDAEVAALAEEYVADLAGGETDVLHDFAQSEPAEFFAQIIDRSGRVIESSPDTLATSLAPAGSANISGVTLFDISAVSLGADPVAARIAVAPAIGGYLVLIGESLVERNATLRTFRTLLWLIGPAILLVVGALGWLLARASLRPVEQLRAEASRISEGDLDRRLQVPSTQDEIARLAGTLNEMLARLQRGFERERRIVDDASHELRTPLGILKTELDLALRRSRTKDEMRSALESAAEVSENLNRLAEDMLVLARASHGQLPLLRKRIDVAQLAREIAAQFARRAQDIGADIEIGAPPQLFVSVDAAQIRQALGNLIDNALGHCPTGGRVTVDVAIDDPGVLHLSVSDTGPGFPPDFLDKAFDPYTRADSGRSRRAGGAGLGLAIVKGVTEAHGGTVRAANIAGGGARVTLRVPA